MESKFGFVTGINLYGFVTESLFKKKPVFQCQIFNVNSLSLETFLCFGNDIHNDVYNIIINKDPVPIHTEEESLFDTKVKTISEILLNNCDLIKKIKLFDYKKFIIQNYEIKEIHDEIGDINILTKLPYCLVKCVGNYSDIDIPVSIDDTVAIKKRKLGYKCHTFMFSLTIGDNKYVFENTDSKLYITENLQKIISYKDVNCNGYKFRLMIPKFFCMLFEQEQCTLLIQTIVSFIHNFIYSDFNGIRCIHNYVGPDLLSIGGDRSIFFVGNSYLILYKKQNISINNIIDEIYLCHGLPFIFGKYGQISIIPTDYMINDDIECFDINITLSRYNGKFLNVNECSVDKFVFDYYLYHAQHNLIYFHIPDFLYIVINTCIKNLLLFNTSISNDDLYKFLKRLQFNNKNVYVKISYLINKILNIFFIECEKLGLIWFTVQNLETFLFTSPCIISESILKGLFNDICLKLITKTPRIHIHIFKHPLFFFKTDNIILCNLLTIQTTDHWTVDGSMFILLCLQKPIISNILDALTSLMISFCNNKDNVNYWVNLFDPLSHPIEKHNGILDCGSFHAVFGDNGKLIKQDILAALDDKIYYKSYVKLLLKIIQLINPDLDPMCFMTVEYELNNLNKLLSVN
ncbi:helicase/primase subunit [Murid herpesvirus 3]|uniref:Helicase/primase subunit n=2 Tax=Murid betaherpesvirus 3 TaxID=2560603 RepID=A0A1P8VIX0_9BETA|nr:helicase/primase subunit [Murine roseolovirus]APZ76303.1 helicase/primase subunit [Murid betaherpesvirus 3]AYH64724.1 helicase/primase subunit [Murid herpesvirus 3]